MSDIDAIKVERDEYRHQRDLHKAAADKAERDNAALIELVKGWEELHAQMAAQMQMVEQQRDTLIADNARLISLLEPAQ